MVGQVVSEYRALRASVLRLWGAHGMPDPTDVRDIGRFNEAIDQAIAESLRAYAAETERRRQLFHESRVREALINLISNAARHGASHEAILARMQGMPDHLLIAQAHGGDLTATCLGDQSPLR